MGKRTNRELVMLAQNYIRSKHRSGGMYFSEKLDGIRCLWLPKTRGISVTEIGFANRQKDKREHIATGLWSRYGKVIHCPEWFVDNFPSFPLDGELWMGRGNFRKVTETVKELVGGDDWKDVEYRIIDAPKYKAIFQDGRINNQIWTKQIVEGDCKRFIDEMYYNNDLHFDATYKLLRRDFDAWEDRPKHLIIHPQELLPFSTAIACERIDSLMDQITEAGGEGGILRHPASTWEPVRSQFVLKLKKWIDAEATVVAFRAGTGKYSGMLGSLKVLWNDTNLINSGIGIAFDLSGFDDAERLLKPEYTDWAVNHNSELFPLGENASTTFTLGEKITFRYRELTDGGVPKEARYLRKFEAI